MNQISGDPLPLFYSYAHEDEALRNELDKHLTLLQHNGLITIRDAHHLPPGADRSHSISQYLQEAVAILLLISPDYLASTSCYTVEMPQALERHQEGDALVVPVLLRPIDVDATPFAHLQCLPRNGKPVTQWERRDAALHEIAKELRRLLEGITTPMPPLPQNTRLIAYHPVLPIQDRVRARNSEEREHRVKYLKHLIERYSAVMLPIGPVEGLNLQAIFQPLKLRYDPLTVEDLSREKHQSLLGETGKIPQEEKEEIIAQASEEALEKSQLKRMVILGGPGTGKTTVLQFLIYEQAQKALTDPNTPLPIMISLPDLARSEMTLEEYLLRIAKEARVNAHFAILLERTLKRGQAFICLDSLDEVAPEQRPDIIRTINTYAASAGNIWIVGSRFTEYKGGQFQRGQFAEWELLPMTSSLQQELASRLFPELNRCFRHRQDQVPAEPLTCVRALQAHTQAATWGENPLLFSLAAVVFVRLGALPASRTELYQGVTRAVLETREKNPARRQILHRVLIALALELYITKERTFSLDYLSALLPDIRRRQYENWATDEMARRIIHCGLFDTLPQETYSFRHQTFQEYLAAEELAQRLVSRNQTERGDAWAFAWSKRRYARWTEVLRLMVGVLVQSHRKDGAYKARDWLHALDAEQDTPEGDPGNLGLALALKSLGEIAETNSSYWNQKDCHEIEEELVASWVARVLDAAQHGYTLQQEHLTHLSSEIAHLHSLVTKVALERAKAALYDEKSEVRTAVIQELGMLGTCAPTELLVIALQDDEGAIRAAAATALGGLRKNIPIAPLIAATLDPLEEVRAAAIEALGKLGERVPLEQLLAALNDPAWSVRRVAVKALGKPGVLISVDQVIAIIHDSDPAVRTAVVEALGSMGIQAPQELLLAALRDPAWEVRGAAAKALGSLGEQMPIEPLIQALNVPSLFTDEEVRARYEMVRSLTQQVERVPVELLQAIMEEASKDNNKGKYSYTRAFILMVIAKMGERAPVPLVLAALKDERFAVRREAVEALGTLKIRAAHDTLLTMFNDGREHSSVRAAAVGALTNLQEDGGVNLLLAALNDPVEQVRRAATRNLAKSTMQASMEQLLTIASEHSAWIRLASVTLLGKLGEQAPLDLLLTVLDDEKEVEAVRAAAGRALLDLGDILPTTVTRKPLHYQDARIRQGILEKLKDWNALAFTEDLPIISLLLALGHEDERVRWRAMNKLGYDQVDGQATSHPEELLTLKKWLHSGKKPVVPTEIVEMLVKRLEENDDWRAARVLGELKGDISVELVQRLFAISHDEQSQRRGCIFFVLSNMKDHLSSDWLQEAMTHEQWQWRETAVRVIALRKEPIFMQPLLKALQDPQKQVRQAAAQALKKMNQPPPAEPLLAALYDEDMGVRLAIALTLTIHSLSPDPVLEALVHSDIALYLSEQPYPDGSKDEKIQVGNLVVQALEKLEAYIPREMLLSTALHSKDTRICRIAIQSLIKRDGDISWQFLLTLMAKEGEYVRAVCSVLEEVEDIPETMLEEAFHQGTTEVRSWIAQLLGRRGKKAPEKLLLQVLDEEDKTIQRRVVLGLSQSETNMPTDLLGEALQHGSSRTRQTVLDVLDAMDNVIPPNLLLIALHDKDKQVCTKAATIMTNHLWQGSLEPLMACLRTETDNQVLQRIARTIGGRVQEEQVPLEPLLNLFDREYAPLRASVIRILGHFGTHAHVEELLVAALGDSEQIVRDAAAAALKQAYPETLRALACEAISILQGEKPSAPFDSIAQAFFADAVMYRERASPAIFKRLTQLLDWPYWQVRLKAIQALGQLGRNIPDEALRRLYELRHDPTSHSVREEADEALAQILSLETAIEDD